MTEVVGTSIRIGGLELNLDGNFMANHAYQDVLEALQNQQQKAYFDSIVNSFELPSTEIRIVGDLGPKLTWQSSFVNGYYLIHMAPNSSLVGNDQGDFTLAHELRHGTNYLKNETDAALNAFYAKHSAVEEDFRQKYLAQGKTNAQIEQALRYGFEELFNHFYDNAYAREWGGRIDSLGGIRGLTFDSVLAAINSGKLTANEVWARVELFASAYLTGARSGYIPYSIISGSEVDSSVILDRDHHEGPLDTFGDVIANGFYIFGTAVNALYEGIVTGGRSLNSAETNAFWDDPLNHLHTPAHDRFVSETMGLVGMGALPKGKTIIPNGGGFEFANDPHDKYNQAQHGRDAKKGSEVQSLSHDRDGEHRSSLAPDTSPRPKTRSNHPIILDLNGNGIQISDLSKSTQFAIGDDGRQHRSAWAAAGDGVLFYDADGDGKISDKREYVFTEWAPGAQDDMEALRKAFDTNGDGKLSGAELANFKVLVTNADGSTTTQTLAQLGITEIGLKPDVTMITLPDGSQITGQSTFVMNGVTHTAGNVTLATDAQGYRVVEVATVSAGVRTVVKTGYAANGDKAFVITSVTSADGLSVTNNYDTNGDGVVDQIQTLTTVVVAGTRTETLVNLRGADVATAVVLSRVVTATSSDGKTVTISRDHLGGGWFDQVETVVTAVDGTRTHVTKDMAQNGTTVIQSVTETLGPAGLYRTQAIDADGNGAAETVVTETIGDAAGVRTEMIVVRNGSETGSLRSSETTTISSDAVTHVTTKIATQDLNGDGVTDQTVTETSTLVSGGGTDAMIITTNADGSRVGSQHAVVSADGLVTTTEYDLNGDTLIDRRIVDGTVIDATGVRTSTVLQANADGSVYDLQKTVLGADKVSSELWIDLNQDGVLSAGELVRSVVVDAATQARTATTWDRNADGTFNAKSTEVTASNGLTTTQTVDSDGDGDTDRTVVDATVVNGDQSTTRTVTETAQDTSIVSKTITVSSWDGLMSTTTVDSGGDNAIETKVNELWEGAADGSRLHYVSSYSGDGSKLLSQSTTEESADRLQKTVEVDSNGDGAVDQRLASVTSANGIKTVTEQSYFANGTLASETVSTITANGLERTVNQDVNGDGAVDTSVSDKTTLALDGSRSQTVITSNGDSSLRSKKVLTVSDDGLSKTIWTDADGDGIFESSQVDETTYLPNGDRQQKTLLKSHDGDVLSTSYVTVSGNGLTVTELSDGDNDGDFDLTKITSTFLLPDGGQRTIVEVLDVSTALRSKTTTTVSDDRRTTTIVSDVNGTGRTDDIVTTRIIALDGVETETTISYSDEGVVESRTQRVTSANGLVVVSSLDQDGDGIYERVSKEETTLDEALKTTVTVQRLDRDGHTLAKDVVSHSADGWSEESKSDLDGDDDFESTTTKTYSLAANGIATVTTTLKAEDGHTLTKNTEVTSADHRTVTTNVDLHGDGDNDVVTVSNVADSGATTSTTSYYAFGGGLEAKTVTVQSGDGMDISVSTDRNGDGRYDLIAVAHTDLQANGAKVTSTTFETERHVRLGASIVEVDGSGFHSQTSLDLDGDGLFERRSVDDTTVAANGTISRHQATYDATATKVAEIATTTSGNGLTNLTETDFNGDGSFDRSERTVRQADGAWSQDTRLYASGERLLESTVTEAAANGRSVVSSLDRDGDGIVDRVVTSLIDTDRNQTFIYQDFAADGALSAALTKTQSANGTLTTLAFDVDGDGDIDVRHASTTLTAANGDQITKYTETLAPGDTGIGLERLVYSATTTTSASGLTSTTVYDLDGDGTADGTTIKTTTLDVTGSRTDLQTTTYADGSLRSKETIETSADGRSIRVVSDYDGNGLADKISEVVIGADGVRTETETAFAPGGGYGQTFVTITTADGLLTEIIRPSVVQTITKSPVNNGSYVWDDGLVLSPTAIKFGHSDDPGILPSIMKVGVTKSVVSHQIDALGIETWTLTDSWVTRSTSVVGTNDGANWSTSDSIATSTLEVRLDATAKAKIIAMAERAYDTVLDRALDVSERELLIKNIVDGQLDELGLINSLISSSEFETRYGLPWAEFNGTLTKAEFIGQLYLNSFGRDPSMTELDAHLQGLVAGTETRGSLAVALSEASEHLIVGNGHLSTNNFDVIMNPATFERSLDKAYVAAIIENIVDVVYDRDATAQEVSDLSKRLLSGTDNPDDIVQLLLNQNGAIQGISSKSLNGLTGAAFVEQAYLNALGREPSAEELDAWTANLASGQLSSAQFVASLAQSLEHLQAGNEHIANTAAPVTSWSGTAGADTKTGGTGQDYLQGLDGNDKLYGGDGSDILAGGKGDDTLEGGAERDTYVWSGAGTGDGNDRITDTSSATYASDTLILKGVSEAQVTLTQLNSEDDLTITIKDATLATVLGVLKVTDEFNSIDKTLGIEAIVFDSGAIWTLDEIRARTRLDGTTGNDTGASSLTGSAMGEQIYGNAGNDSIVAFGGDDSLYGGVGNDTLYGGSTINEASNGEDSFFWAKGDGNDTIQDHSWSSSEIDTLVLTNATAADVTLRRSAGDVDLEISISNGGTTETITVVNQYADGISRDGIEKIQFSDGTIWSYADILQNTLRVTTAGNDGVSGTNLADNIYGGGGNDSLASSLGDDRLSGGVGVDTLNGEAGSDTYLWQRGDGNDIIKDTDASVSDLDRLVLSDVKSSEVYLYRVSGSNDLKIRILSTSPIEELTVTDQLIKQGLIGLGIEGISFSDGVIWTSADILARTEVWGPNTGAGADSLLGLAVADNIFGGALNDTLIGNAGDDLLEGGTGIDSLDGGGGNDRFVWSAGDGNDVLKDTGTSLTEVDTLELRGINSADVSLSISGSDLVATVVTGGAITVKDRFVDASKGYGIELIEYADGVTVRVLNADGAVIETSDTAGTHNASLQGWAYQDLINGLAGNDTLVGLAGDDTLNGGVGLDLLKGGMGSDSYVWARNDGNDTISDDGSSQTESDTLVLSDVTLDQAVTDLKLIRLDGGNDLLIQITTGATTETITVQSRFAQLRASGSRKLNSPAVKSGRLKIS